MSKETRHSTKETCETWVLIVFHTSSAYCYMMLQYGFLNLKMLKTLVPHQRNIILTTLH